MKLLVFDVCLTEILIKLAWLTANEIKAVVWWSSGMKAIIELLAYGQPFP